MPNDPLTSVLLDYVRRRETADSRAVFSVAVDDPNVPTYKVNARSYYDADRVGFSDYLSRTVARGLDQNLAVDLTEALNGDT